MCMYGPLLPIGLTRAVILGLLFFNVGCMGTSGWAMNRSGMRQYSRGHFAHARHRFARAVAHDPCNADYRHNLAMSIQKQGDMVASEKILRHNLTINAMHQPTYHSLAQMMVAQGRAPEAQDLLAGWVATQPYVPEANIEMAWLQKETGDVGGAEQSLQQALKVKPTHPVALAHLGQLYHGTGHPDLAATYYQRSLAANWDQPEVQSRLATLTDVNPSSRSRSAMMQNSSGATMVASNPILVTDSMAASGFNMSVDPMMANGPILNESSMLASSSTMMGDSMLSGTPTMALLPTYADGVPFGSDSEAVALEDVNSNPPPRQRRRKNDKNKEPVMTAFPLPNFDSPATAWVPSGTFSGQPSMAYQTPEMGMNQMAMPPQGYPQMAGSGFSPTPLNGNPMGLIPQADPAHFEGSGPEMTASLPVVDPH